MAKRAFELSEAEIGKFRQAEGQTRDVQELKRLQATRLYGSGVSLSEIMRLVGSGESTIRQWAMRYKAGGLAGPRSQWKGGNANKLSAEQRAMVKEKLHQYRPVDLHLSRHSYWMVSDLQVGLQQWCGVRYKDEDSYHALFRACGFSYQCSAKVYRSQPSPAEIAAFEADAEKK